MMSKNGFVCLIKDEAAGTITIKFNIIAPETYGYKAQKT